MVAAVLIVPRLAAAPCWPLVSCGGPANGQPSGPCVLVRSSSSRCLQGPSSSRGCIHGRSSARKPTIETEPRVTRNPVDRRILTCVTIHRMRRLTALASAVLMVIAGSTAAIGAARRRERARLPPPNGITGRVVDRSGTPVKGTSITPLRPAPERPRVFSSRSEPTRALCTASSATALTASWSYWCGPASLRWRHSRQPRGVRRKSFAPTAVRDYRGRQTRGPPHPRREPVDGHSQHPLARSSGQRRAPRRPHSAARQRLPKDFDARVSALYAAKGTSGNVSL